MGKNTPLVRIWSKLDQKWVFPILALFSGIFVKKRGQKMGQKMGFLKIWPRGLSRWAKIHLWCEFGQNRTKNEFFQFWPYFQVFLSKKGVKKWKFWKSDPAAFLDGQKYTFGANFVKIRWKLAKPLLNGDQDFEIGVPFLNLDHLKFLSSKAFTYTFSQNVKKSS